MTYVNHLPPLNRQFVAHFGEMGSRWGINRTVGQMYALIFLSPRPLNADEIAETLEFSRSNVSMGLKELQAWRLVKLSHQPGDRREYFEAPKDVWEIFRVLAEERRRREIQRRHNEEHGITPRSIVKQVRDLIDGVYSEKAGKEAERLELAAVQRAKVEEMSEKDISKAIKQLDGVQHTLLAITVKAFAQTRIQ